MPIRSPVLLALLVPSIVCGANLYVSVRGNDSNPGTRVRPFATLERARDAVQLLRQSRKQSREGVTVWIGPGDYVRTNSFELTESDSGTAGFPVVWRGESAQTVRLLGARALSGFEPVTDPAVLARLDEGARTRVLCLNVRRLGIDSLGEIRSRGFGRPSTPSHCELFFAGRPMTVARWPNEGEWERIAGWPPAKGQEDGHKGEIGKLEEGFSYDGDRPARWKETANIWVHGYWAYDWANSYERVTLLDLEQHLIKTATPYGQYGFRKGQRFYYLNVLEELDQPGEWFFDRNTGVLYFWPPDLDAPGFPAGKGVDQGAKVRGVRAHQSKPEVLLSLLSDPLFKLTGVDHVSVSSLTLEATRGNAIEIRGGSSNRISDCTMRNIGDGGVTIDGGTGHGVVNCQIFDTGDGGVSLKGGDRQTLTSAGHFVENCHFARQGRWSKCYVPAVLMEGVGLRASHNLIHDHPHCAILFSGNDHLIEFNEIHHIALETGDVGAIYAGRDYTYRGNRIRNNFIHHTGGVGMGSMGVYMDDCVSGTEIYGNIFYKVQRAAFLGGGRDHQVLNNIFVDCNHAVELDGRGLDSSPTWRDMVDQTMRKSLAAVPAEIYRERYPALKTLDAFYGPPAGPVIEGSAFKGVPPENNNVAHNICVGKWLNVYWHAPTQMLLMERNLTNSDPRFVRQPDDNSRAVDFSLKADSPAWKLGFQKIPTEQIGRW